MTVSAEWLAQLARVLLISRAAGATRSSQLGTFVFPDCFMAAGSGETRMKLKEM
jgi:hypothetical protein